MNEMIRKLAINANLLNYVDLETPRQYFVHADIEEEDIERFALYCVRNTIKMLEEHMQEELANNPKWYKAVIAVLNEFQKGSKREQALDEMVRINEELELYDEQKN